MLYIPGFLDVKVDGVNGLEFQYTMSEGTDTVANYGLLLAKVAGIPAEIIAKAMSVVQTLCAKDQQRVRNAKASIENCEYDYEAIYGIAHQLSCLRYSDLCDEELRGVLAQIKEGNTG
eukprot:5097292-Pyramimonas_sp.AAC.2